VGRKARAGSIPAASIILVCDLRGFMKVWGLTGQLGSGKTAAVEIFLKNKIPVLEVDKISPKLLDKNTPEGKQGFEKIYRLLGNSVLDKLGNLDRTAIRKRIAQNPHEKQALEEIINPILHKIVSDKMTEWKSQNIRLGIIEGARIFESGIDRLVFKVLTVSAPQDQRIKRISKRDSLGKDEALMLVQMQESQLIKSLTKKEISNDKKLGDFEKQIESFILEASQP
jgi:dephospho-CoA kinase